MNAPFPTPPPLQIVRTRTGVPWTPWTDERVELLKRLWGENLSCAQIASALGSITRNAVIGKVYRLGLTPRVPRHHAAPRTRKEPGSGRRRSPRQSFGFQRHHAMAGAAPAEFMEAAPYIEETSFTTEHSCDLLELTNERCRWPIGDPRTPGFAFCGTPTADVISGRSYCRHHTRMAYLPARPAVMRPYRG
jgi:GcrA cell cycle regulator